MQQKVPDYFLCANCETPCYVFETDQQGKVVSAFCAACGNDEAKEFWAADDEGDEDDE
jgi:hypothetical protein